MFENSTKAQAVQGDMDGRQYSRGTILWRNNINRTDLSERILKKYVSKISVVRGSTRAIFTNSCFHRVALQSTTLQPPFKGLMNAGSKQSHNFNDGKCLLQISGYRISSTNAAEHVCTVSRFAWCQNCFSYHKLSSLNFVVLVDVLDSTNGCFAPDSKRKAHQTFRWPNKHNHIRRILV